MKCSAIWQMCWMEQGVLMQSTHYILKALGLSDSEYLQSIEVNVF